MKATKGFVQADSLQSTEIHAAIFVHTHTGKLVKDIL